MTFHPHSSGEFTPREIHRLQDAQVGLDALVVVDDTHLGVAIGGVRMTLDGSMDECIRLAHAMTLKNAAAGLPHGGGKAIILASPDASLARKQELITAFAKQLKKIPNYVPGPDMGTNEELMVLIKNITGRVIGLPVECGGIPLDKIGATGYGLSIAIEVALKHKGLVFDGLTFIVQGFGAVGQKVARCLSTKGAIMVGVADVSGARLSPTGIAVDQLCDHVNAGNLVTDFSKGCSITSDDLIAVECDLWIPAARPDVFTSRNAHLVKAKIIAQGANIPATLRAEEIFHARDILVLPDFIANAGGVICGAVEFAGGTSDQALAMIEKSVRANMKFTIEDSLKSKILPRKAAAKLAIARLNIQNDGRYEQFSTRFLQKMLSFSAKSHLKAVENHS
jgi:glutamate dehydrogenase (NAD(P)+)